MSETKLYGQGGTVVQIQGLSLSVTNTPVLPSTELFPVAVVKQTWLPLSLALVGGFEVQ